MKKVIMQSTNDGLESLMGEKVTLFCARYIYTGLLIGVDDKYILLEDPGIVYSTGDFKSAEWKDCQKLPKKHWYVMLGAVESFGIMK